MLLYMRSNLSDAGFPPATVLCKAWGTVTRLAGLACGIFAGLVFGLAQQARGAHLLSHDVWSAMLAWLIPLSVYAFAFKRRLWRHEGDREARPRS